jgi:cytochrome c5
MFRFPERLLLLVLLSACEPGPIDSTAGVASYDGTRVGHYGYGVAATEREIAGWDIDIRPDGQGLPEGAGSVEDGEVLYEMQCAECHGSFGEGVGRFPVLAGGEGTLRDSRPLKTIGSYWPYTSTLFDYIRRTMPFAQPESLSNDETYAVTAYVLYLNDLVDDTFVLTQENLANVRLPNEASFVADPRPDVANQRCMDNCRDPAAIEILSEVVPEPTRETEQKEGSGAAREVAAAHPGTEVYDQFCSICHAVGVAGAPRFGEVSDWTPRLDAGIEALVNNSIEGVTSESGVMPPKGGFAHLSDDQVRVAVEYMVDASR